MRIGATGCSIGQPNLPRIWHLDIDGSVYASAKMPVSFEGQRKGLDTARDNPGKADQHNPTIIDPPEGGGSFSPNPNPGFGTLTAPGLQE
jgi:hypothetical protein